MSATLLLKSFISSLSEGKRGNITIRTCTDVQGSQGVWEESTTDCNLGSLLLLAQSETALPRAFEVF